MTIIFVPKLLSGEAGMRSNATRIELSAIPCRRERSNDSSNCTNVYFSSDEEMLLTLFFR